MGVIIDTNIFEHSQNRNETRQKDAEAFLSKVENAADQIIYVDNELDFQKSVILSEYRERLVPGTPAHTLLFKLIKQNRVRPVSKVSKQDIEKLIKVKITDKTDRIFLKIANNTPEKLFASHDFTHIPNKTRNLFKKQFEIKILSALECIDCL